MKDFGVVMAVIAAILCFGLIGYVGGHTDGANQACKSVKLEWVKDKCMKVTREAV